MVYVCVCAARVCLCVRADEEDFLSRLCDTDDGSDEVLEHKQATQVSYTHTYKNIFAVYLLATL